MPGFIHKKIIEPLVSLLKQGITPQKLAQTLSMGIVIACIPIIGITTGLCAFVAYLFRLNQVAIQIANYAAYPLQIALLIPFFRAGEKIFGVVPASLNVSEIIALFKNEPKAAFTLYGMMGLRGVAAWAIAGLIAGYVLYYVFLFFIKRMPLAKTKDS